MTVLDTASHTFSASRLLAVVRENRDFRRLFAANAVSQLGDWFNIVALFSLLVELTGAGEAVAIALMTRFVPSFVAGPAAGVLADRIPRKYIMIASDLLRAGLVLCLILVRRPDQVWIAFAGEPPRAPRQEPLRAGGRSAHARRADREPDRREGSARRRALRREPPAGPRTARGQGQLRPDAGRRPRAARLLRREGLRPWE